MINDTQKIKNRLKDIDIDLVDKKLIRSARKLLGDYRQEECHKISEVLETFFLWVSRC